MGALAVVWRQPWTRVITYLAALALLVTVLWTTREAYAFALQVAVIGFFLAYVLNPVVAWLCGCKLPRWLAVAIVYLSLLLLMALGTLLVAQVVSELDSLVRLVPVAIQSLAPLLERAAQALSSLSEATPDWLRSSARTPQKAGGISLEAHVAAFLEEQATLLTTALRDFIGSIGNYLFVGVAGVVSITAQVFFILTAGAYFLYDFPRISANSYRYVPNRWDPLYHDLLGKADRTVGGYLRGQLVITSVLGVLIWIGLSLAGIPLALAISFLAAIFNVVPYLGPIIGVVPAVLLGLTVSPFTALLALGVFFIANQLEGNVLSPMVLSKSTNLHPLTVLFAILLGAGLLGLMGALLAVPVVALAKVLLEDYLLTRPEYQD